MQLLRQAGYGGHMVPVNPKGGAKFGYEAVTSIGSHRSVFRSFVSGHLRLAEDARLPLLHRMIERCPAGTDGFAAMKRADMPSFDDVGEMAE